MDKYTFLGWSTSKTAKTATYAAGANYTANAAITLYAVWKLAYTKPTVKITSLTWVKDAGTITGCKVACSWSCMDGYLPTEDLSISFKSGNTLIKTASITKPTDLSGTAEATVTYAFSADLTYTVVLTLTDSVGSYTASKSISGTPYTIHVPSGGNGIAFGKASTRAGCIETAHNMVFDTGKNIYGTDPNDGAPVQVFAPCMAETGDTRIGAGHYTKNSGNTNIYGNAVNIYTRTGIGIGKTLPDGSGFIESAKHLKFDNNTAIYGTVDGASREAFIPVNSAGNTVLGHGSYADKSGSTRIYGHDVRLVSNNGVFIDGLRFGVNQVLWSGELWMKEEHQANLAYAVSSQPNGIVLVWSEFDLDNSTATNANFNTYFVPKQFVANQSGRGLALFMTSATMNLVASKYVYINDTTVFGYSYNNAEEATRTSGITSTPKRFVLRYVIGV
jgi:hypothetical protein